MEFSNTLVAVKDMEKTLKFYKELFNQEVTVDIGWNKTLTCGLVLQEHFDKIADFPEESMKFGSNTMELYFHTEDFDGFIELLNKHPEVKRLHEPRTFPWLQRGIHIFDPNDHLIEVSESMYVVGCKLFKEGKTIEETVELTQHPKHVVEIWYKHYLEQQYK